MDGWMDDENKEVRRRRWRGPIDNFVIMQNLSHFSSFSANQLPLFSFSITDDHHIKTDLTEDHCIFSASELQDLGV